jgi:hypothetical protein
VLVPLLFVALTASSSAENAEAESLESDPSYVEGQRFYNNFEFEKAAFRFRASSRSSSLSAKDAARAQMWLGLALGQAGDEISARDAFAAAKKLDANIALPDDAPPTLRPIFADAHAIANAAPAAPTAVAPPPTTTTIEAKPKSRLLPLTGAGVAGVGVVLAGAGAVIGIVAIGSAGDAAKAQFQSDAIKAYTGAQNEAIAADVLVGVGAAALAAGAAIAVASAFVE